MKFTPLKNVLEKSGQAPVTFLLPDGDAIPAHFHITEVGYVTKRFIDCGGTVRSVETCQLQLWLGSDEAHRITAGKAASILDLGRPLLPNEDIEVEVEYEDCSISQYTVESAELQDGGIIVALGEKHTDCLAKESCGLKDAGETESCCGGKTGCC